MVLDRPVGTPMVRIPGTKGGQLDQLDVFPQAVIFTVSFFS